MGEHPDILMMVFNGLSVCDPLRAWLENQAHVQVAGDFGRAFPHMGAWRNHAAQWFLDNSTLERVLFLDHDMVPFAGTEPLLEADVDVASALYVGRGGDRHHQGDGLLSAGCLLVTRYALEHIKRPWFDTPLDPTGCGVTTCECLYFVERAKAAGFYPVRLGVVGHIVPTIVIPGRTAEETCQFRFLHEYMTTLVKKTEHGH